MNPKSPRGRAQAILLALLFAAACREPESVAPHRLSASRTATRSLTPSCSNQPVPKPQSNRIGINVHELRDTDPTRDDAQIEVTDLIRRANIGWVKVDLNWYNLELSRDNYNWSELDVTMTRAYCAGLNVVGTLAYTPVWASSHPSPNTEAAKYNPADLNDWASFVRTAVDRYPWVRYWSIWNEPNSSAFYLEDAAAYSRLLKAAAPAIRENYDSLGRRFLIAPEVGGPGAEGWARTVLDSAGSDIDVVSLHAYGDAIGAVRQFRQSTGVQNWRWPIWMTETDVTGCRDQTSQAWCVNAQGTSSGLASTHIFISDSYQTNHVKSVYEAMLADTVDAFWEKTFFYDATSEPTPQNGTEDYGVLGGFSTNALYAKGSYYSLARAAGINPGVTIGGPSQVFGNQSATFVATVSGGHVGDAYDYVWTSYCGARFPTPDCDGESYTWDWGWNGNTFTLRPNPVNGIGQVTVCLRDTRHDSPASPVCAAHATMTYRLSP